MVARPTLFCLILAWPSVVPAAALRPAAVFSDHMVLQREKPVPIWGWADPGERVTVDFAGQSRAATAGADGAWRIVLDPLPANSTPESLTLRSDRPGRGMNISDVLVGEVWLGSGQSNMAMPVMKAMDFDRERAAADLPEIRMFTDRSPPAAAPQAEGKGAWVVCSPATVGGFSATLFFFGREIQRELGVPVGLINASVGGTRIASWIAPETQLAEPVLRPAAQEIAERHAAFDPAKAQQWHRKALARWEDEAAAAKAAGRKKPPRKPDDPVQVHQKKGGLGGLFNGKIAPWIPVSIRGVVWYQGEANAHEDLWRTYQQELELLVTDWRRRWGEELPFAWVQLPNLGDPEAHGTDDGWMHVREAMRRSLRLPRTGMAITVDIGDPRDIHPPNKQEVGRRLALWALGDVYGRRVPATSGPLPAGHEVRAGAIAVPFAHAAGLRARTGEPRGFLIAGANRLWKPARGRIEGQTVVVSSPEVPLPLAVRYAWATNPDGNLVNEADLPASPFRTDDWDGPAVPRASAARRPAAKRPAPLETP